VKRKADNLRKMNKTLDRTNFQERTVPCTEFKKWGKRDHRGGKLQRGIEKRSSTTCLISGLLTKKTAGFSNEEGGRIKKKANRAARDGGARGGLRRERWKRVRIGVKSGEWGGGLEGGGEKRGADGYGGGVEGGDGLIG